MIGEYSCLRWALRYQCSSFSPRLHLSVERDETTSFTESLYLSSRTRVHIRLSSTGKNRIDNRCDAADWLLGKSTWLGYLDSVSARLFLWLKERRTRKYMEIFKYVLLAHLHMNKERRPTLTLKREQPVALEIESEKAIYHVSRFGSSSGLAY